MSTFVSPRRAGILPPYLLEHVAQAAPAHARQCALLSRQITAQLRQQRALGLLARADAPAADAKAQQTAQAVQRRIYDAQQGTTLPGTLARDEGAPATQDVAVTEAYDYLGATHDFFQTVYGRDSIDAAGPYRVMAALVPDDTALSPHWRGWPPYAPCWRAAVGEVHVANSRHRRPRQGGAPAHAAVGAGRASGHCVVP